jgi:hypothetical protein
MANDGSGGYICHVCGERHILPLSYSVKLPVAAKAVPSEEIEKRIVITPDQCVIDNKEFFLRGRIPIPIHGLEEPFIWGVWAEVGPKDFLRTTQLWNTEGRETEPPFPGYLNNEIPLFGDTINLEVNVQTQVVGRRPSFFVLQEDHPLAIQQRDGLSLQQVEEIAEKMQHPETQL